MDDTFNYQLLEKNYGKRRAKYLLKHFEITNKPCPECESGLIMISRKATVNHDRDGYSVFIEMICTTKECTFNPIKQLSREWGKGVGRQIK